MFKRIIEIDRNSVDIAWPSEEPTKAALYQQLRDLRAAFPGFVSVETTSDDVSLIRTEYWKSFEDFSAFIEQPEVIAVVSQLLLDEYIESNGMLKVVRDATVTS